MSESILRLPQVMARVGMGKSLIYKKIGQGRFPKQVQISEKVVGWLSSDIDRFIDQRVSERDERDAKRRAFQENGGPRS